jgi:glutathione S-transferase
MNNTVHPTFTHFFRPEKFAASESARADIKAGAVRQFRQCLERIQEWIAGASPFWHGARISVHDAYAFVFLRWGGFVGVDPKSLPAYHAYIQRVMQAPPVAAALARERIGLDTYKGCDRLTRFESTPIASFATSTRSPASSAGSVGPSQPNQTTSPGWSVQ